MCSALLVSSLRSSACTLPPLERIGNAGTRAALVRPRRLVLRTTSMT